MVYLAIGFVLISQLANSFCDAVKFSRRDIADRYDNLWHWIKWPVDRVCLFLAGFFSFDIVKNQFDQNDLWHYNNDFYCLVVVIVLSIFVAWPLHYRYWKMFFNGR